MSKEVFISIKDGEALDELCKEFNLEKHQVVVCNYETWSGGPYLKRLKDCDLLVAGGLKTPWDEKFYRLEILNWD